MCCCSTASRSNGDETNIKSISMAYTYLIYIWWFARSRWCFWSNFVEVDLTCYCEKTWLSNVPMKVFIQSHYVEFDEWKNWKLQILHPDVTNCQWSFCESNPTSLNCFPCLFDITAKLQCRSKVFTLTWITPFVLFFAENAFYFFVQTLLLQHPGMLFMLILYDKFSMFMVCH